MGAMQKNAKFHSKLAQHRKIVDVHSSVLEKKWI